MLVGRVGEPIEQKILGFLLLPVCSIQNGQEVRKGFLDRRPHHLAQFIRRPQKHQLRHDVLTEEVQDFPKVATRRVSPTPELVAQLLKLPLSVETAEKEKHAILEIQLPVPIVTFPPRCAVNRLHLSTSEVGKTQSDLQRLLGAREKKRGHRLTSLRRSMTSRIAPSSRPVSKRSMPSRSAILSKETSAGRTSFFRF